MKKITILFLTALTVFSVFTGSVYAQHTVSATDASIDTSIEASTEVSDETSAEEYISIEKIRKKTSWAYYLLSGIAVAGVISVAVILTKKKD